MFLLPSTSPPYLSGAPQDDATDYTPMAESLRTMPNSALIAARQDPRFPSSLVDAELSRRGATTPLSQYVINPAKRGLSALTQFGNAVTPLGIAQRQAKMLGRGLSYLTTPQLPEDQLPSDVGLDADGGIPATPDATTPPTADDDAAPPDVAADDSDADFQTSPPPMPGAKPPYMPDMPDDSAAPPDSAPPDAAATDDGSSGPSITPEDYPPPGLTGSAPTTADQSSADLLRQFGRKLLTDDGSNDGDLALAKAGFAMMASRSPYLFGAIGEGGQAGITALDQARRQRLDRQVRGASMLSAADYRDERAKNQADTLQYRYAALKSASEDRALTRQERADAARQANALRLEIAKIGAGSRENVATIAGDSRTEAARIRAERAAAGVTEPLQKAMDTYDKVKDDPQMAPIAWQRVMHVGGFKSPQDVEQFAQRMAASDLKAQLTPPPDPDAWREQRLQYYRRMMNPTAKGGPAPAAPTRPPLSDFEK